LQPFTDGRQPFRRHRGNDNRMRCSSRPVAAFAKSEDGQDLIEYALILAFLALSVVASMSSFTSQVGSEFNRLGSYM
jgi:Flp pilus assembly pilin Flp